MSVLHDDVLKWLKRLNRKGPFHLLRTEPYAPRHLPAGQDHGTVYVLIWDDGEKFKIGDARDNMSCRYGFNTRATLKGTSVTGLWQASNGAIDDAELAALLAFAKGDRSLPVFDLRDIRDLSW